MLGGILVIAVSVAAAVAYRRGRVLRHPTPEQVADIAAPLGRILVRYLPLDVVGPTLVDVTEAAAATHGYLLDGPLVERAETAHTPEPTTEDAP